MNCRTVRRHLPRYVDQDLPDEVVKEVGIHLVDCDECQLEFQGYRESSQALVELGDQNLTAPAIDTLQRNIRNRMLQESLRQAGDRALRKNTSSNWGLQISAVAAAFILIIAGVAIAYMHYYESHAAGHVATTDDDPKEGELGTRPDGPGTDREPPGAVPPATGSEGLAREDPDSKGSPEQIETLYPFVPVRTYLEMVGAKSIEEIETHFGESRVRPKPKERRPEHRAKLVDF